jgi:hypothetical protein
VPRQAKPGRDLVGHARVGGEQRGEAAQRVGRGTPARFLATSASSARRRQRRLGQHHRQHAALLHPRDRSAGIGQGQQVEQLHRHALAAEALERGRELGAGVLGLGVERAAEAGLEAVVAQDAQVILADALARVADEAHAARVEVGEAAEKSSISSVSGARRAR